MKIHLFYPSGNLTALIVHKPQNSDEKLELERKTLSYNKLIEQVGFIYVENNLHKLEMAHNELCVNAVFSYLKHTDRNIEGIPEKFYLVGPNYEVLGRKNEAENIYSIEFPPICRHKIMGNLGDINLPGITHIFFDGDKKGFRNFLNFQIEKLGKNSCDRVTGINHVEKEGEKILKLTPYIYYHKEGKTIPETSCSSGSIALVAKNVFENNLLGEKKWLIKQVSGKILVITAESREDLFYCSIENDVLFRETFEL